MKKLILFIAAVMLMCPTEGFTQETETLFSGDVDHGGFGAPVFGMTSVNGDFTYLRGSRGAWVINLNDRNTVNLGLARYRTQNDFEVANWTRQDVPKPELDTDYGGFEVEYVHRTNHLFHFSVQTLVGSGSVNYEGTGNFDFDPDSDGYFVLQPGVNLNLNVTDWFRLSGGLSYRYAGGVDLEGTSDKELSGVSSFFAMRFGWF